MTTHLGQNDPTKQDTNPEIRVQPAAVVVHDVVRGQLHHLSPHERTLRVPYDLFNPTGPARLHDGLITYQQAGQPHTGRVAECELMETHAGERVLVRLPNAASETDEWWLVQVKERVPSH